MNLRTLSIAAVPLLISMIYCTSLRAEISFPITVAAGEYDRENAPVMIPVDLEEGLRGTTIVSLTDAAGNNLAGQITEPSVLSDAEASCELHFIVPKLAAGETLELTVVIEDDRPSDRLQFHWEETSGDGEESVELRLGDRPVLRYMHTPLDTSTDQRRMATYKVFHHVYDPTGARYVTKGPGGLYPHHRGLFFGFNRIRYGDGQQADIWHCNNGESQSQEEFLATEAGPVLGRHTLAIDWHGKDGEVFAKETREITAYHTPGGVLIEFATKLESVDGTIHLDGDPQHAGFQFRASQEVPDSTANQTYYLRPDGRGEPGQFRNWPQEEGHVNLPWNALSFVLGEQRYTCCYIDRPENPKEARFSERNYGRFGSYFQYDVEEGAPLELNYRIWLQEGEMEVADVQAVSDAFVHRPTGAAQ